MLKALINKMLLLLLCKTELVLALQRTDGLSETELVPVLQGIVGLI